MSKSLDRLSKLIAQADNAGTPEEAAAFYEKAEELSSLIGVELAVARAHHAAKERELPVKNFKVQVNDWLAKPIHRRAMMDLFLAIARAHDVKCLIGGSQYFAFCFGLPSDIDMCEKLFGMLSLQMVREADAAIKRGDQKKGYYRVDGRIYRRHFYEGFTDRVSGRLWESRKAAMKAVDEMAGSEGGTDIVLRDKAKEINDLYQETVEHMRLGPGYGGLADVNEDYAPNAVSDGNAAGSRAQLGLSDRDVSTTERRALT